jgi:hypothetical protein
MQHIVVKIYLDNQVKQLVRETGAAEVKNGNLS